MGIPAERNTSLVRRECPRELVAGGGIKDDAASGDGVELVVVTQYMYIYPGCSALERGSASFWRSLEVVSGDRSDGIQDSRDWV